MNVYRFALGLAFVPLIMGADKGCIAPMDDTIVRPGVQPVSVYLRSDDGSIVDGKINLSRDGTPQGERMTSGGTATFPNVDLKPGVHTLSATSSRVVNGQTITGNIQSSQVEVRSDIVAKGRQEVVFNWLPIAETKLREMAIATLEPDPTPAQLDQFLAEVKAHARQFFIDRYSPFNIVLVSQPTAGRYGLTTVTFDDRDPTLGETSLATTIEPDFSNLLVAVDFNNNVRDQRARVFLGVIKNLYVVPQNYFIESTAAELSDTLAQRSRDFGIALGRLATHEVGHTLGLVADFQLGGCDWGHNCRNKPTAAKRVDGGWYIMDPGEVMPLHVLFGHTSETDRTEKLAAFNNYNASYLRLLHPKP